MYDYKKFPLEELTLIITEDCNLACKYCYRKKRAVHMTKEIIKKSVDFLNQTTTVNSPSIKPFGAEVFLVPELLEFMFDYAVTSNKNIRFSLQTNGTLLNSKIKKLLTMYKPYISKFVISLDGLKKYHDKNRVYKDGTGTWDSIIKNLDFFKKLFPNLSVETRFKGDELQKNDMLKSTYV